jgi:hypothetical protein
VKKASITEAKNNLSAVIDSVKGGRRDALTALLASKPPRARKGASGVGALLDERRDGR